MFWNDGTRLWAGDGYYITVDGAESVDVVAVDRAGGVSYTEHGALMKWDYGHEDPHRDARGFRAKELRQDTDDRPR